MRRIGLLITALVFAADLSRQYQPRPGRRHRHRRQPPAAHRPHRRRLRSARRRQAGADRHGAVSRRRVQKNDISAALDHVIRDSRAYYLIAYESPHPEDGKFHKVTVRVKRPRATVFARSGYWAFKRGENSAMAPAALVAVPPAVRSTAPGPVTVSGRLLDRRGQPLTDLRLTPDTATPELRLALGSLGPGEYVIELAQQFIAFRVVR